MGLCLGTYGDSTHMAPIRVFSLNLRAERPSSPHHCAARRGHLRGRDLHLPLKTERRFCCSHQRRRSRHLQTNRLSPPNRKKKTSPKSVSILRQVPLSSPPLLPGCLLTALIPQNIYNLINKGSQEDNNMGLCVHCSLGARQLCNDCMICAGLWPWSPSRLPLSPSCYSGSFSPLRASTCAQHLLILTILSRNTTQDWTGFICVRACCVFRALFRGGGRFCGGTMRRRCQAHFSSAQRRSASAASPPRHRLSDTYGPLGNPPGLSSAPHKVRGKPPPASQPQENKGASCAARLSEDGTMAARRASAP